MKEVIVLIMAMAAIALFFLAFGVFVGSSNVDVRCDSCGRIYSNRDVSKLSSNDDLLILCNSCYKKTISDLVKDKMIFQEDKEE